MVQVVEAVAIAGLVLSIVATVVALAAEVRSRRTDRRLEMMGTPKLQVTCVDAQYQRSDDHTRVTVRARVMNPGFVEDSITSASLNLVGLGETGVYDFGRPVGEHGLELDTDRKIRSPEDSIFDFIFDFDEPLAPDGRAAVMTVHFLRHTPVPVRVTFGS